MPLIFISYRRNDSLEVATHLKNKLSERFGDHEVFLDMESIRSGEDWDATIRSQVASCKVLIVLIGNNWQSQRLQDNSDYVRLEIKVALDNGAFIIPLLVNNAIMPMPDNLPQDILPLLKHQASIYSTETQVSLNKLITAIDLRRQGIGPSEVVVSRELRKVPLEVEVSIFIDDMKSMFFTSPGQRDYRIVSPGTHSIWARFYHSSYSSAMQAGGRIYINMKSDVVRFTSLPNQKIEFVCEVVATRKFLGIALGSKLIVREVSRTQPR